MFYEVNILTEIDSSHRRMQACAPLCTCCKADVSPRGPWPCGSNYAHIFHQMLSVAGNIKSARTYPFSEGNDMIAWG